MRSKLILIEGLSGVGKSTLAQFVSVQINRNEINAIWYQELERNHPIIPDGVCKKSQENGFVPIPITIWEELVNFVNEKECVVVLESSLFQYTLLNYFASDVDKKRIIEISKKNENAIRELNPVIIYLSQSDVKNAFDEIIRSRGADFKEYVIRLLCKSPYMTSRNLSGWDGIADRETGSVWHQRPTGSGNRVGSDLLVYRW